MEKKKLKLKEVRVKSFTVELQTKEEALVKGGAWYDGGSFGIFFNLCRL